MKKNIQFYIFLFVLASLGGWIIEFVFTTIKYSQLQFPGCFYGPYLPIYGFGGVLLMLLARSNNKVWEFIKVIFLMTAIEYLASYLIELTTGVMWWDYSRFAFNINKRVCLRYSLYWGMLGSLYLNFVERHTDRFYSYLKNKNCLKFFNIVFTIIGLDMITTVLIDLFYKI